MRPTSPEQLGRQIYETTCVSCHGGERKGAPPLIPALLDVKLDRQALETVIREGRNGMPAFRQFRPQELNALAAFLATPPGAAAPGQKGNPHRYTIDGYTVFTDQHGVPAIAPPWGTLNAIDLVERRHPLEGAARRIPPARGQGHPQHGIDELRRRGRDRRRRWSSSPRRADEKIRAFEKHTGRVLWEHQLPAGGYATPSVYMLNGRQYVAIAAGGSGKNATKSGDSRSWRSRCRTSEETTAPAAARPGRVGVDSAVRRQDAERLGPHERRPHLHGRRRRHRRPHGREQRRMNSFLCTLREFDDFELELET